MPWSFRPHLPRKGALVALQLRQQQSWPRKFTHVEKDEVKADPGVAVLDVEDDEAARLGQCPRIVGAGDGLLAAQLLVPVADRVVRLHTCLPLRQGRDEPGHVLGVLQRRRLRPLAADVARVEDLLEVLAGHAPAA